MLFAILAEYFMAFLLIPAALYAIYQLSQDAWDLDEPQAEVLNLPRRNNENDVDNLPRARAGGSHA